MTPYRLTAMFASRTLAACTWSALFVLFELIRASRQPFWAGWAELRLTAMVVGLAIYAGLILVVGEVLHRFIVRLRPGRSPAGVTPPRTLTLGAGIVWFALSAWSGYFPSAADEVIVL